MSTILEGNLQALARLDAALAERMRALPWPDPSITPFRARSGAPSLRARAHDGEEIRLHSEYDPLQEASQFLEARTLSGYDSYLLNGIGLGYVALELGRRAEPRRWIALIEAHEGLFRAALEAVDLTPLFGRGNVGVFVGRDPVSCQTFLRTFLIQAGALKLNLIAYPPCHRFFPAFYQDIAREVEVAIRRQRVELATVFLKSEDMDRNAIRNIEAMAASCPASRFRDSFKGMPAVVLGAGPSLNAAIPLLRQVQDRVLLVGSDVALRLLVKEGVAPHFVATLDMKEATSTFFQGFQIPERTRLVFDPDAYHGTVAGFPGGRVSYSTAHGLQEWSRDFLGESGFVDKGTSVAHSAFFFARLCGADPILLVGVDLSYPSGHTHADGVQDSVRKEVKEEASRWIMVPGVDGKPVRTISNFSTYITHFEGAIAKTDAKVVQTSEIGALIRGAECLPLGKALERYASRDVPVEDLIRTTLAQPSAFDRAAFEAKSEAFVKTLRDMLEAAEEGIHAASQASRRDPSNRLDREALPAHFKKMRALQDRLLRDQLVIKCIERQVSGMLMNIRTLDREIDDLGAEDPERVRKTVRQFSELFSGFKPALEFFLAEFEPMRRRLLDRFPVPAR